MKKNRNATIGGHGSDNFAIPSGYATNARPGPVKFKRIKLKF
jgi:hypothetical protein